MCSYKEINEWFKWKNTPVKDRKLQSVEEKFMVGATSDVCEF